MGEKNVVNAKEAFKQRRAAEELTHLRKKMERMKKFEMASSADQVLAEELKEYKEIDASSQYFRHFGCPILPALMLLCQASIQCHIAPLHYNKLTCTR